MENRRAIPPSFQDGILICGQPDTSCLANFRCSFGAKTLEKLFCREQSQNRETGQATKTAAKKDTMPELIGILIVVAIVIVLVVKLWFILLPAALIGLLFYFHNKNEKKKEAELRAIRNREEAQIAKAQRQKEEYEATQRQLRESLTHCVSSSEVTVTEIKRHIADADKALSEAEYEFAEGAFAPFWDAVERAANRLAQSDAGINSIILHSKTYREQVTRLDSSPPPFSIAINTLPDTTRVASRMRPIVRAAQKDIHFAQIYEQRMTNKLLIAGFTNLADALNRMGERLEYSIDALTDSMSEIADTHRANTEELISSIASVREVMESDASARREHEEKQREMLDNIQRRRKP